VGQVLLNLVYKHLGLDEKDYFGLMFTDDKSNVVSSNNHYYMVVVARASG